MSVSRWVRYLDRLDSYDKPIAAARQRLNKAGFRGVVSQGFTNLEDGLVQSLVEVHKSVVGPNPAPEIFPRNHLTRLLEQQAEYLKGLSLKFDLAALAVNFPGSEIRLKNTKTNTPWQVIL
jgi:hypothetical protein